MLCTIENKNDAKPKPRLIKSEPRSKWTSRDSIGPLAAWFLGYAVVVAILILLVVLEFKGLMKYLPSLY